MTHSPPVTEARTTHALLIRVGGKTIGGIYDWNVTQSRDMREPYAINLFNRGLPADMVPGNVTNRSLSVKRYDLYTDVMEECFGTTELEVLSDQVRPLSLREVWLAPGAATQLGPDLARAAGADAELASLLGGSLNALLTVGAGSGRLYEYKGVWFTDLGRTSSATGDRVVGVDATLKFQWRHRLQ